MSTAAIPQSAPLWSDPHCEADSQPPVHAGVSPTLAEVWFRVGQVPLQRILANPPPGTATIDDAVRSQEKFAVSCELVNGVLVAKTMGFFESKIALRLAYFLQQYLEQHPIGEVNGIDGPCETVADQVRKPDVLFVSNERLQKNPLQDNRLPCSPELAVEVLSPGNTTAEMDMKLREYFATGAKLVWYIEPELKTARVYTAVDHFEDVPPTGVLRGNDVLPGFELPLARLFEKAGPRMEEGT